jgi:thiol-disulfide isomerase/thioredoxin
MTRVTRWRAEPPPDGEPVDADHDLDEEHHDLEEDVVGVAELADEPEPAPSSRASALAIGIEADDPTVAPSELDETGPRYPGDTGARYDRTRRARPSWREGNMLVVILAMAALVVGGGIAALVVTLTGGGSDATELGEDVQISGTLPTPAESGPDPGSGTPAPAISGTDLDGHLLSVVQDGRPHVLAVLTHWCPHCQATVPQLVRLNEQKAMNGVSFYGVVTAITPEGDNYPPSDWLRGENWPFPTFLDNADNQIARSLGVTAFPFYVFVDKNNNVVGRVAGELSDEQLTALFRAVAAGQQLPITYGGDQSPAPTQSQAPATAAPRATTTTRR